jgi:multiple sugar transport system substrate-binding protein
VKKIVKISENIKTQMRLRNSQGGGFYMIRKVKIFSAIMLVAVFIFLISSCAPKATVSSTEEAEGTEETAAATSAETEAANFAGVKLTIPAMEGWSCIKPIIDRAGEFKSKTGIEVEYNEFPFFDMYEKQYTEAAAQTGAYDTAMVDHEGIPTLRESGAMLPLNDFIKRDFGDVEKWKASMYPVINVCEDAEGNILFIPFHANEEYIAYQENLFNDPAEKEAFKAEYGYDLQPPTSYQQLIDIAKFFTRDTNNDGEIDLWGMTYGGEFRSALFAWFNIATSMGMDGTRYVDDSGNILLREGTKDYEASLAAMQYWYDLLYKYKVVPLNSVEIGHAQVWEMWKKGQIAMSQWWWGDYWTNPDFTLAGPVKSAPFPRNEGVENCGWGSWWTFGIYKSSPNPEAAWEFLKWVISEEMQSAMSEGSGQASPFTAYTQKFAENGWVAPALLEELSRASYPASVPENVQVHETIRTHLGEVLTNAATPSDAMKALSTDIQDILGE